VTFAILCTFRPGGPAGTKALRGKHYEFLLAQMGRIVEGGPLVGLDGIPTAMLMVVEAESVEEAREFIAGEPYTHAGLFDSVMVRQWRHVLPEAEPGAVAAELARERAGH